MQPAPRPGAALYSSSSLRQPTQAVPKLHQPLPAPPTLMVSKKSTMYSYASACAFTRVSVPSTGSAKASMTMKVSPTTLPCITPITSMLPPDLACIAIFSSASAEMRTLRAGKRGGRRARGGERAPGRWGADQALPAPCRRRLPSTAALRGLTA